MTTCDEVWADDSTVLCNDGHVLEIFGRVDGRRFHLVLQRPKIEVIERKRSTRVVITAIHSSSAFDCDPARADDVRAFAARLAAALP
ncbi:hypothetical protein [Jiangella anatolica]|uniref:Uncharacterized protein n=1 Tax=Jiangella anatolica TaxID=2670374 RepID=A0A2W2C856_9ACTN|nr:hypothetical protein [Jiangella anatolica]PZF84357.1 hypothetical protein C1I92_09015 [Jiangella anatolica]